MDCSGDAVVLGSRQSVVDVSCIVLQFPVPKHAPVEESDGDNGIDQQLDDSVSPQPSASTPGGFTERHVVPPEVIGHAAEEMYESADPFMNGRPFRSEDADESAESVIVEQQREKEAQCGKSRCGEISRSEAEEEPIGFMEERDLKERAELFPSLP